MEEEEDDDEWRPQQFYLDVISGACEPIGGELSGQFPGTAWASTDLFVLFRFVVWGFCFLCLSFRPGIFGARPGPARTFFFFFFFLGFSFLCQLNCFRAQRGGGWLEWRSHGLLSLVITNLKVWRVVVKMIKHSCKWQIIAYCSYKWEYKMSSNVWVMNV